MYRLNVQILNEKLSINEVRGKTPSIDVKNVLGLNIKIMQIYMSQLIESLWWWSIL